MNQGFYDLSEIRRRIQHDPGFLRLIEALGENRPVSIDGVFGGAVSLIAAALAEQTARTVLLVLPESEAIDKTLEAVRLFTNLESRGFPAMQSFAALRRQPPKSGATSFPVSAFSHEDDLSDTSDADDVSGDAREYPFEAEHATLLLADDLFGQRLELLKLVERQNIVVSSIDSLLLPVPDKNELQTRTKTIRVGDTLDPQALSRWLLEGSYHRTPAVDLRGEFAIRGSLLDLFAPDWEQPVRIEFFGDEVESLRRFDIASQRSLETLKHVSLTRIGADERFESQLLDLLDPDTVVVLVEAERLESSARAYLDRVPDRSVFHDVSGVLRRFTRQPTVALANLAESFHETRMTFPLKSVERLQGSLATLKTALDELRREEVCVVCPTESEIERLREAFGETLPGKEHRLFFQHGELAGGFQLDATIVIGSGQMFARSEIRRPRRRQLGQVIDSFLELKPGDLVVHVSHGIGRFRGLKMLKRMDLEEEHLELEYADHATLYVPVSKIALVQKYVGGTKSRVPLAKLGGQAWGKQKRNVQKAVFDLAVEMLEVQAARETFPGIAYPEDTRWQAEFDAAFPYRETEDQLVAIDAVKNDMKAPRPMDRLICGDVGFGKTEVAMRAAFKAVDAGYQVAVLVPTTVLAEQHYRTFSERMRAFPFSIAPLSRFQSKKEQTRILEDLALGTIDIVIGTHRIVSRDVRFHNLGLVVIDEEQRFGVDHKERLKRLRQSVDVLTLTATPIPRTLHFSLLGLRDISNLETPPEDRVAVETRLVRIRPELIRTALLRELARGGQAFFVHNRVADIEETAAKIRNIVPEARIGVGHAQMNEHELETVMREFVRHEFDVLVCTTIIESGLDIPNANTIFIDRADRYGLADLHQLRGRVGRYKNQAYCYLLLDANQPLMSVAAKRLRAVEEFSHLGAGFNLAMRDLEIRGAGNILGTQQSGHIATVGYEMYCEFLEGAVRSLRQIPPKHRIEVEIDLPGRAAIPKTYVSNPRMKIDLYRRITRISKHTEYEDLREEIADRFGKPPQEVLRLLDHARIRVAADSYGIRSIHFTGNVSGVTEPGKSGAYLVFEYVSRQRIEELRDEAEKKLKSRSLAPIPFRFADHTKAYLPLYEKSGTYKKHPERLLEILFFLFSIPQDAA